MLAGRRPGRGLKGGCRRHPIKYPPEGGTSLARRARGWGGVWGVGYRGYRGRVPPRYTEIGPFNGGFSFGCVLYIGWVGGFGGRGAVQGSPHGRGYGGNHQLAYQFSLQLAPNNVVLCTSLSGYSTFAIIQEMTK